MSICVMFGEDCIAIYVIIGYWNQVSLGVVKSINGLSEVVVTRVETVDIFGNAWIGVFGRTQIYQRSAVTQREAVDIVGNALWFSSISQQLATQSPWYSAYVF